MPKSAYCPSKVLLVAPDVEQWCGPGPVRWGVLNPFVFLFIALESVVVQSRAGAYTRPLLESALALVVGHVGYLQ
jgi:hypothetical protein